ncbi:HesA/MoeB/ThiF family protein [Aureibacter tunicatorum]|uniref:Molybdopterin-synthase adenylyltransferase n=1 Tax=Aureibacter tunicatorum TaxID=866807 RepID=A0AAE4BT05_9BACT|nr:HesA/MoeB/ThiF family protein [Aureibacter tunicatorum]MDR6241719.1 adenylyltransferase/sulfurtransferase [Aureibacter tunicatorum]BDD07296.1 molybdenum cofactor biosynthesis protein MoeB [Aureibacter tunicatorum]
MKKNILSAEERIRYSRHLILPEIGHERQMKLKNSSVLMIGAGGLGCPVLQYLTAAGVGKIGIIDNDKVDFTNLQRQIIYTTEDIGKYKAEVAQQRLSIQNPFVDFEVILKRFSSDNALELVEKYDLIIDGSDNFETRYLLNDACVIKNKPFIYGSIYKFEGQVSVFNYKDGPTYRCLFPEPPNEGEMPNCSEIGVIGILPGVIGSLQANEAIKVLAEIGEPLNGKLLSIDLLNNQFFSFDFEKVPEQCDITELDIDYSLACALPEVEDNIHLAPDKIATVLDHLDQWNLIDVRDEYEFEADNIGGVNIPIYELEDEFDQIDPDKPTLVICQVGLRSLQAVQLIKNHYPDIKIYHFEKGLDEALQYLS